jgi:hypothetical protein
MRYSGTIDCGIFDRSYIAATQDVAFVPQAATCDIANYAKADRIMKREGLCL